MIATGFAVNSAQARSAGTAFCSSLYIRLSVALAFRAVSLTRKALRLLYAPVAFSRSSGVEKSQAIGFLATLSSASGALVFSVAMLRRVSHSWESSLHSLSAEAEQRMRVASGVLLSAERRSLRPFSTSPANSVAAFLMSQAPE